MSDKRSVESDPFRERTCEPGGDIRKNDPFRKRTCAPPVDQDYNSQASISPPGAQVRALNGTARPASVLRVGFTDSFLRIGLEEQEFEGDVHLRTRRTHLRTTRTTQAVIPLLPKSLAGCAQPPENIQQGT